MDAKALELLGKINISPAAVMGEYPDNSADAGATQIWVVLEPGRISIVDNGHGMIPDLLPEDQEYYRMFLEDVEMKKIRSGYDLRDFMSPPSLKSVRWMMECVAYSSKRPQEGELIRGMRGIGAQGFRQIAGTAVWLTRPSADLASAYWTDGFPSKGIPTVKVIPPSAEQLEHFDTTYQVLFLDEPLLDPWGKQLESGTRVEIFAIRTGLENALRPESLNAHFQGRFGEDIRSGRFRLWIVDRVSEVARKSPRGERVIEVQPHIYRGILVVDKTAYLRGGRAPFRIQIYYDPNGRGLRVMVRRRGTETVPLTDLDEFVRPPFNSGKLSGFVEFPDLPESEAPWSADKRTPLESPVRNQWQKEVWDCAPEIEIEIARLEERTQGRKLRDIAQDLATATLEAVREVQTFQDLVLAAPQRDSGRGQSKGKSPAPDRLEAVVFNEHNRGVAGVPIELLSKNTVLNRQVTGRSGKISFGKLAEGRYILRPIPPNGMVLMEPQRYVVNITESQQGFRAIFRVVTGAPGPERRRIHRVEFIWRVWGDPDQPYRSQLAHGRVEINAEATDVRRAIEGTDDELLETLLAQYAASAVTEYGIQGEPPFILTNASLLFARLYNRLRQHRQTRHRREAASRRRH